jgi:chromosome segregation ATPase
MTSQDGDRQSWKQMESKMNDPKKSAEALRKIQEIKQTIASHQATIARIEHEKSDRIRYHDQQIRTEQDRIKQMEHEKEDRIRYYDQQIKNEQDRIKPYDHQIEDLKRQI